MLLSDGEGGAAAHQEALPVARCASPPVPQRAVSGFPSHASRCAFRARDHGVSSSPLRFPLVTTATPPPGRTSRRSVRNNAGTSIQCSACPIVAASRAAADVEHPGAGVQAERGGEPVEDRIGVAAGGTARRTRRPDR
ncbi:hypothetical protein GCM10023320_48930 [Pseudonocardia adelaidensis]|uniref:Uncharacterized protein n=1 Tax=Pseudonocardia adelaidensis TaxID=648754 RepID=A0ABP9NNR4_9PSEU